MIYDLSFLVHFSTLIFGPKVFSCCWCFLNKKILAELLTAVAVCENKWPYLGPTVTLIILIILAHPPPSMMYTVDGADKYIYKYIY